MTERDWERLGKYLAGGKPVIDAGGSVNRDRAVLELLGLLSHLHQPKLVTLDENFEFDARRMVSVRWFRMKPQEPAHVEVHIAVGEQVMRIVSQRRGNRDAQACFERIRREVREKLGDMPPEPTKVKASKGDIP